MIRYVFLLFLLVPMVHADLMERMGSEVQEFRIYPRIQKAENLIAKGDLKEAKILLEKVLDIKPDEKRSSQMLANICLELEDKQCLEKYIHTLKPKAFVAYALAYINYKDKNYAKAYALSKSVDANKLPSKSQRQSLKIIQLQSAIILGKTDKLSSWLSGVMNTYPACSNIRLDMISLLLEYHHIKEALPYIKSIKKSCKSNIKVQKKLLVWAEILRDENYKKESLSILSSLPDSLQKDEAQLSVLITKKAYTKALNVMEKIYAIEPNEKNTKRLAYLYSKTHRYKPLKKLYIHAYKKKPDPDILKHILYSEKSGEVDTNYLEAYYPYDGLSVKEKFNFSAALIKKYKKEGKQTKIPSILNDLSSYAPLSTKEKEVLSHLYLQNGNIHQSIKLMEELYSSHPEQKYRKKLLYLYDKAGNFTKQQESLLLSSASKKCDADTIHAILNLKSISNNSYKKLENYLPFSCVNEKTKRNAAKKLGDYYKKYGQKKKFLNLYRLLSKDNSLSVNALFDIAYLFKRESSMRDYVSTLSKILKKNPRHYHANLALGEYKYKQKDYKQALKYFKNAYRQNPKKKVLARMIGETYLKMGDEKSALKAWQPYIQRNPNSDVAFQAASLYFKRGNLAKSKYLLSLFTHVPKNKAKDFYMLKGTIAESEKKYRQALKAYKKALKYAPLDTALLYKSALLYEKTGQYDQAVATLEKSIPLLKHKERKKYYAQIGFWAQKYNDHTKAVNAFTHALKYKKNASYYKALAYSQFKLKKRKESVENYKNALDTMETQKLGAYSEKYAMKQSIAYMNKQFSGYFAFVSGSRNTLTPSSLISEQSLGGYTALRLNYTPKSYIDRLQIYLSTAIGVKNKSAALSTKTTQPSIGVSYQVSKDTMIVVAVEKLIKGGSGSRDDVMARLSGEFFDNYSFDTEKKDKWFKHLYLDMAYFLKYDSYRFFSKYDHGYLYYTNQDSAWLPYISSGFSIDNDNRQKNRKYNFDLGLGISHLFWMDEGKYTPHQFTGKASLEARHSLKTNYEQKNVVQMMLEVLF